MVITNKLRCVVLAAVTFLVMSGCATSYQGGVDALQVNDTTYRISASGNGHTSSERVHDFVLLRASEIAINRGYEGFVIGDMSDQTRVITSVSSGQVSTSSAGTMTVTPATISTAVKPGFITFVTLVREGGMDAKMIYASLAPKYGVTSGDATSTPLPSGRDNPPVATSTAPASGHPPVVSLANAPPATRHALGIRLTTVTSEMTGLLHMEHPKGLLVVYVEPGDVAAAAGIRKGDVLLKFADVPVTTNEDVIAALASIGARDTVSAEIWRNGQAQSVSFEF
jgi:hypothetical protein